MAGLAERNRAFALPLSSSEFSVLEEGKDFDAALDGRDRVLAFQGNDSDELLPLTFEIAQS